MLFLWILLIIIAIVFLKYAYLVMKRLWLLRKISKRIKKHGGSIQYLRNPLVSVFKCDGKTDIMITLQNKTVEVSVITTPFRRVRYHFNDKLLELIVERRAVFLSNMKGRVPSATSTVDRAYVLKKYKIDFEYTSKENQRYVILNPAPIAISKAQGSTAIVLYNNDLLFNGARVCGLKWFAENVI